MKIVHIVSSIDISTGGPALSVTSLINGMLKNSLINIELVCNRSKNPINEEFINDNGGISFVNSKAFGFPSYLKSINNNGGIDLLHGHGLWQLPVHKMARFARKNKIPHVITPRGMMEPWSLNQRKIKKKIAFKAFQEKDLKSAACIHATATTEAENIRNLGYKNPIAVIPNGIDLNNYNKIHSDYSDKSKNKKTLLFLSRIHPKKGIELLIEAWSNINLKLKENWVVEIAGNGDPDYIEDLRKLILNKGLKDQIKLIGPQFGHAKLEAYSKADIFVLPTYSENFGIVVAEALASGVPVITTKGAPWKDLVQKDCGWWIDVGVEPLKVTLEWALKKSPGRLAEMGKNGRDLVQRKYSIEAVSLQMIELYEWILGKGDQPDFVMVN